MNSNGRFVLGLGSQVKQHDERRFEHPMDSTGDREWVSMSRRYARSGVAGKRLRHSISRASTTTSALMTPTFSPPPIGLPMVPITIAAVGPAMLRLAGRHCDGVRLHAFCTRAYAEQVVVPEIEKGLSQSGRSAKSSR